MSENVAYSIRYNQMKSAENLLHILNNYLIFTAYAFIIINKDLMIIIAKIKYTTYTLRRTKIYFKEF